MPGEAKVKHTCRREGNETNVLFSGLHSAFIFFLSFLNIELYIYCIYKVAFEHPRNLCRSKKKNPKKLYNRCDGTQPASPQVFWKCTKYLDAPEIWDRNSIEGWKEPRVPIRGCMHTRECTGCLTENSVHAFEGFHPSFSPAHTCKRHAQA